MTDRDENDSEELDNKSGTKNNNCVHTILIANVKCQSDNYVISKNKAV